MPLNCFLLQCPFMTKESKTCTSVQAPSKTSFPELALILRAERKERGTINKLMMSMPMKIPRPEETDKKGMIFSRLVSKISPEPSTFKTNRSLDFRRLTRKTNWTLKTLRISSSLTQPLKGPKKCLTPSHWNHWCSIFLNSVQSSMWEFSWKAISNGKNSEKTKDKGLSKTLNWTNPNKMKKKNNLQIMLQSTQKHKQTNL